MRATEKPTFEKNAHRRLYRYIERHGAIDPEAAQKQVNLDVERFQRVVSSLKQAGCLREVDGALRVALDGGVDHTYSEDGIEYRIRPARQEDFSGIVKIMRQITTENTYVVAESIAEQLLYEDTVIRHNDAQSRLFFVATVDGTVVGWTHIDTSPLEKLRHTARQTVGVLEIFRGYGIGARLMNHGLNWAADRDIKKVYNSLPATNQNAIGFLETFGWEREARRRDTYRIDGDFVDEVLMAVDPAEVTDFADRKTESTAGGFFEWASSAFEKSGSIIERWYRAISRTPARFNHGGDFVRGVLLGIDPLALLEMGTKSVSETWVHERDQFDPDDWGTVGAKTTVQFLETNPPRRNSLGGGALLIGGLLGGVILTALTQIVLWSVTVPLGLLNLLLRP